MFDRPHIVFPPDLQSALSQYIVDTFVKQTDVQAQITATTTAQGLPQIDLRPEEGWMIYFLLRLIGAKRAVEIGTLAGYSASWIATALGEDGKLYSLELNENHATVARENLAKAGLASRVEVVVGSAHETLKTLTGTFDIVFLDADRAGYPTYLQWALEHVRTGGLVIAHNAFQHGDIVRADGDHNENAIAMQAFNTLVAQTNRLLSTIIPVGDGLLVAMVQ